MRPGAFGDVWDKMSPRQRRRAWVGDIIVGIAGTIAIYWWMS